MTTKQNQYDKTKKDKRKIVKSKKTYHFNKIFPGIIQNTNS